MTTLKDKWKVEPAAFFVPGRPLSEETKEILTHLAPDGASVEGLLFRMTDNRPSMEIHSRAGNQRLATTYTLHSSTIHEITSEEDPMQACLNITVASPGGRLCRREMFGKIVEILADKGFTVRANPANEDPYWAGQGVLQARVTELEGRRSEDAEHTIDPDKEEAAQRIAEEAGFVHRRDRGFRSASLGEPWPTPREGEQGYRPPAVNLATVLLRDMGHRLTEAETEALQRVEAKLDRAIRDDVDPKRILHRRMIADRLEEVLGPNHAIDTTATAEEILCIAEGLADGDERD